MKDSEVKKTFNISINNQNRSSGSTTSQTGQTSGQSRKKSSYLQRGKKDQSSDMPITDVNITVVKKDWK